MIKNLYIQQLELGSMANFSYLVGDKSSGEAAVIDPNDDTPAIEAAAAKAGLKVTSILLTHGHFDHTGGLKYYSGRIKLPAYLSDKESMLYVPSCKTLQRVTDHAKISIGNLKIECIHTPGHTPGCVCYFMEGNLFTGDTLFVNAIGRTDLPGGSASALFQSLQKIKQLPDDTMVWPGHNYGDTNCGNLKTLKIQNPFLACATEKDFLNITG